MAMQYKFNPSRVDYEQLPAWQRVYYPHPDTHLTGELISLFYTIQHSRDAFMIRDKKRRNFITLYDALTGCIITDGFQKWSSGKDINLRTYEGRERAVQTFWKSGNPEAKTNALLYLNARPSVNSKPYQEVTPDFTYHKREGMCIILPALDASETVLDAWRQLAAVCPDGQVLDGVAFQTIRKQLEHAGYSIAHKHPPKSKNSDQFTQEDEAILAALNALGTNSERAAA